MVGSNGREYGVNGLLFSLCFGCYFFWFIFIPFNSFSFNIFHPGYDNLFTTHKWTKSNILLQAPKPRFLLIYFILHLCILLRKILPESFLQVFVFQVNLFYQETNLIFQNVLPFGKQFFVAFSDHLVSHSLKS